jgi:enoyl-CoA hydratase
MEIVVERKGPVVHLVINRPEVFNALNRGVLEELGSIFQALEGDKSAIVVLIRGAGEKAFVAGADIREIKEAGRKRVDLIREGQRVFSLIRKSAKVVLAVVNGYALGGGCELALSCDIRLASENSRFAFPEPKLALMPGFGGTQLLPRLVGVGRAKWMLLTGQMIDAQEAFRIGLVDRVFPPEKLLEEAQALADRISGLGPMALRGIKRAIERGMHLSLDEALECELDEYGIVAVTQDAEEGMDAFTERRTPIFRGE